MSFPDSITSTGGTFVRVSPGRWVRNDSVSKKYWAIDLSRRVEKKTGKVSFLRRVTHYDSLTNPLLPPVEREYYEVFKASQDGISDTHSAFQSTRIEFTTTLGDTAELGNFIDRMNLGEL